MDNPSPFKKEKNMKRYFLVTNIVWDTEFDGEEQIVDLPNETVVTADDEDIDYWEANDYDWEAIEYYILDYLTDEYEWCIAGSEIKEMSKKEYDAYMQSTDE